jgi:hypothetical protein
MLRDFMKCGIHMHYVFARNGCGAGMVKVVQTTLAEDEYTTLREVLKRLSPKEGLYLAVTRLLPEKAKLVSSDSFLSRKPAGRSGRKDLSKAHGKYLYLKR